MAGLTHEELSPARYDEQWCAFAAQVTTSMLAISYRLSLTGSEEVTPAALKELLDKSKDDIVGATDDWQAPREQRLLLFRDVNYLLVSGVMRLNGLDATGIADSLALRSRRGSLFERAHEHWRNNAGYAGSTALCNMAIYKWFTDEERAGGRYVDEFDLRAFSDLAQIHHAPHTVRNLGGAAYLSSVKV